MPTTSPLTRRDTLKSAGALGALALAGAGALPAAESPKKPLRIGVVSAAIKGKPQPRNGHIWHFAQGLHPVCDLDALKRHYPYGHKLFSTYLRNPKFNFDALPFPDTRITHYYDADPTVAVPFTEVFPGVQVARSLDEMLKEVDAVWMGDASGLGEKTTSTSSRPASPRACRPSVTSPSAATWRGRGRFWSSPGNITRR